MVSIPFLLSLTMPFNFPYELEGHLGLPPPPRHVCVRFNQGMVEVAVVL